jgi:hypothetical protein
MRSNLPANCEAIGIRQHDIEQQQIRLLAAAQLKRAAAGLDAGNCESLFFQVVPDEREKIGIVLDQGNLHQPTFQVPDSGYKPVTDRWG